MEPGAVVERLWPGGEAVFEPLGGGITNRNFKVVVGGAYAYLPADAVVAVEPLFDPSGERIRA